jgi:allantoate deiminase
MAWIEYSYYSMDGAETHEGVQRTGRIGGQTAGSVQKSLQNPRSLRLRGRLRRRGLAGKNNRLPIRGVEETLEIYKGVTLLAQFGGVIAFLRDLKEHPGLVRNSSTIGLLDGNVLASFLEVVLVNLQSPGVILVGKIEALPGAINVIPGRARFSLDVRAPTDSQRERAIATMREAFAGVASRRKVTIDFPPVWGASTTPCAPWLQAQFAAAIESERLPARYLPSGAGHDGMAMIAIADIGMLFVRCKGGISHNPAEAITREDADVAARALLRFVQNFRPRQ